MTPQEFIKKWKGNPLSESAGAQPYFIDLCHLLDVDTPNDPDNYCFERGAKKTGSGEGWADVWKRGCFGWENKGPGGNLEKALKQLMTYALALDNPPLLVTCNREIIYIHTHFTGTPSEFHTIHIDDIGQPENLKKLKWVFEAHEKFRPQKTLLQITADAAGCFADIAKLLTDRGHEPRKVAHFLIQCLFCMFAEDVELLPDRLFEKLIDKTHGDHEKLSDRLRELFKAMQTGGGFGIEDIAWFNGGLFEVIDVIDLEDNEIKALLAASRLDWSQIEPSIFGTLFERGLDPRMRAQLGAQYTDPATIMKLVTPVIVKPLLDEWESIKPGIAANIAKYHAGGKGSQTAFQAAQKAFYDFLKKLHDFRVLDPACGSGNFL